MRALLRYLAQIPLWQLDLLRPSGRGRSTACHALVPPQDHAWPYAVEPCFSPGEDPGGWIIEESPAARHHRKQLFLP